MEKRFYFDTSIWLDFLENRDEPEMPKGTWAKELIKKIVKEGNKILFSDNNMLELINNGYFLHILSQHANDRLSMTRWLTM